MQLRPGGRLRGRACATASAAGSSSSQVIATSAPSLGQRQRDGRADALLRARHERDLACQFHAGSAAQMIFRARKSAISAPL